MKQAAILLATFCWLAGSARAQAPASVAVSPGSVSGSQIGSGCPTFSWGEVEGALDYELLVYALGDGWEVLAADAGPLVRRVLPGGVTSWTPDLKACFAAGDRYAWVIRVREEGKAGAWSEPLLFEIAAAPSRDQLVAALEVWHHLAQSTPATVLEEAVTPRKELSAEPSPAEPLELAPVVTAGLEALGVAALTIEGEVRTIASYSGAPRLWGRGRPGTVRNGRLGELCTNLGLVRIGLSNIAVDWGSAADACPAGTWVCTRVERGISTCNTLRSDGTNDGRTCSDSSIDFAANSHHGWVADVESDSTGWVVGEGGIPVPYPTCYSLPVWCCDPM